MCLDHAHTTPLCRQKIILPPCKGTPFATIIGMQKAILKFWKNERLRNFFEGLKLDQILWNFEQQSKTRQSFRPSI